MNDQTFTEWLAQIDAILTDAIGLTTGDLPAPYRDRYDDEATPADTATEFAYDWYDMGDDIAEAVASAALEAP